MCEKKMIVVGKKVFGENSFWKKVFFGETGFWWNIVCVKKFCDK